MQPTGPLHVGNYLGTLQNFLAIQSQYECYFAIVDYHSITENYQPKEKYNQILSLAMDYLAAGIDPKKCVIFLQSDVPEHTELAWVFNTITPMSELERMTQFKDKASRQAKNINAGLFTYPVLQAADILLYKAKAVPVGLDQEQHLELARKIARWFNNKFGQTFPEPETLFTDTPKVMSLQDPNKKMSKSLGENHCIFLDDEPKVIEQKIKKAVTDTGDGQGSGAKNLLLLFEKFGDKKTAKKYNGQKSIRYADLKTDLAKAIITYFSDFRKTKSILLAKPKQVEKILAAGAKKSQKIARTTMREVRQKIGIRK